MAEITSNHFQGAANLNKGQRNKATLEELLRAAQTDLASGTTDNALLFQIVQALADKLDADAGVTDTDYRTTIDIIAAAPTALVGDLNLTQD